jgi:monoamine oxidase
MAATLGRQGAAWATLAIAANLGVMHAAVLLSAQHPHGSGLVTDLPPRKIFYFDEAPDRPAVLLGSYADASTSTYWTELAGGASNGARATPRMLAALEGFLHEMHPSVANIPAPLGSAFMHWGADPHEIAWTLWRAGVVSDAVMAIAPQPDPSMSIYLAGESFSRSQTWVEGALETGAEVVNRLLAAP